MKTNLTMDVFHKSRNIWDSKKFTKTNVLSTRNRQIRFTLLDYLIRFIVIYDIRHNRQMFQLKYKNRIIIRIRRPEKKNVFI